LIAIKEWKMKRMNALSLIAAIAFIASAACARGQSAPDVSTFAPFQQWMGAVLTGDGATLKSLYSMNPAAEIEVKRVNQDADADIKFWLGLKAKTMNAQVIRLVVHPDRASIIFSADIVAGTTGQKVFVTDAQGWQKQGDQWRIVGAERTESPQLKQPADMKKNIYPDDADAHAEIREAEARALPLHKRLLLVFGANWCFDCHVLDLAFQRPDLAPIIAANYEVVHIDIGPDGKKNADIAQEFQTTLDKGVPVLAVAGSDGKIVYSQKEGEFEDARALTPDALAEFLNKWKP
jgi:thioredoxin 1